MGIFSGLFKSRDKPQNRTAGSNYAFFFGGTTSGKAVTERSAMQMTAVYSCVRILSEAVAGLPLHLYKYTDSGGKAIATDGGRMDCDGGLATDASDSRNAMPATVGHSHSARRSDEALAGTTQAPAPRAPQGIPHNEKPRIGWNRCRACVCSLSGVVAGEGIEPPTRGFSIPCSTN